MYYVNFIWLGRSHLTVSQWIQLFNNAAYTYILSKFDSPSVFPSVSEKPPCITFVWCLKYCLSWGLFISYRRWCPYFSLQCLLNQCQRIWIFSTATASRMTQRWKPMTFLQLLPVYGIAKTSLSVKIIINWTFPWSQEVTSVSTQQTQVVKLCLPKLLISPPLIMTSLKAFVLSTTLDQLSKPDKSYFRTGSHFPIGCFRRLNKNPNLVQTFVSPQEQRSQDANQVK